MSDHICVCEPVLSVVEINGVPIHALTPLSAFAQVEAMLKCPATHIVNHVPADPIVIARRDISFRSALRRAHLNLPDGMGVVWAAKALGIEDSKERVYGPDFMLKVMEWGVERGIRHALVGGSSLTLESLVESLRRRFPGLDIVAAHSPPIRPVTREAVHEDLSKIQTEADMIWVGLGTPKQQMWADLAQQIRSSGVILTVGAAFDFLAGTKRQAPLWIQRSGLEWLFRLKSEPRRLWRRYLLGNPLFISSVALERLKRLRSTGRRHRESTYSDTTCKLRGVVLLVGPDGAGKTTIAECLRVLASASKTNLSSVHSRPGLIVKSRRDGKPVTEPHHQEPRGATRSILKICVLWLDYLIGWSISWRPQSRRGLLVIERGWFDQVIDPRRYRIPVPLTPLVVRLGRLLPRAELGVILGGAPSVIDARKSEIGEDEVARQLRAWRRMAPTTSRAVLELDTTQAEPEEVADRIWSYLEDYQSPRTWRRMPLTARRLAFRAQGNPAALTVYRPHSVSARLAFKTYRFSLRTALARRSEPPFIEVGQLLNTLGLDGDGVAAFRSSTPERWVLGISRDGQLYSVMKVGSTNDYGLRNEVELLKRIQLPKPFAVPRLIWSGSWRDRFIVITEAVPLERGEAHVEIAAEISTILVRGLNGIGPIVHGDLAPWNILPSARGWLVIDWEAARIERAPLCDLFHFVFRSGQRLRRYSPAMALRLLTSPEGPGLVHLRAIGEDEALAKSFIREHLSRLALTGDQREKRYLRDLGSLLGDL